MKRFVCFLLALVMILGMIPNTVITANAYSVRNISDKAIDILCGSVTFYEKVTGGKVGYSTPIAAADNGKYLNGISKEDAVDLMRDYIEKNIDKAINDYVKKNNIDLSKNEHDAIAVHYYRNGNANKVLEAVRTVKTVNSAADREAMVKAFVDARRPLNMSSEQTMKLALDVSMAEAAMYLYADYIYNGGDKLAYTLLDNNGDMKSDDVVAYVKADGYTLQPKNLGWYLYDSVNKKLVGAPLTKLTADYHGKMVVAKVDNAADYIINTSTFTNLNVYKDNKTDIKGELKNYTDFKVGKEEIISGIKWIYGIGTDTDGKEIKGWIKIGKLEAPETLPEKPIATAIAIMALNIRKGATADSDLLGTLSKGDVVNVYEIKVEKTETGNKNWGKISFMHAGVEYIGWINLAYAEVNETLGESGEAKGQTGKIVNADEVNVRSEAGISATNLIASLARGTAVTVLETKMNGDAQWGLVKWTNPVKGYTQGWVYMHYVQLDSAYEGSNGGVSTPETVKYTGVVTSNINLNVRRRADIYSTKVDSLPNGTKINVYETATSRNMKWGRIGTDRWICLTYVNLTEVQQPAGGSTTETTTSLQATVTAANLDVLKNYNSNSGKVGALKKGDVVTILEKNTEKTETGSRIWGRISEDDVAGWINLAYVELKNVTSVNGSTNTSATTGTTNSNGATAVIANCISVNIREGAGVSNAQITKLNNGTAVKVYDRVTKDNAPWAKITWNNGANSGWVCMNYVEMTTAGTGVTEGGLVNGTNSNTISATGVVNSNIDLNVRSIAGLNGIKLGALKKGAKVTVYEQVSADGMIWGRIPYGNGSGWICMSYISIESASSTGKGVMGTIARCFAAVNVRSAPGTNNALINKIAVGTRVEVFETKQHGTGLWGRVAQGWVSMDYVLLDTELPPGTVLDATVPTTEATKPNAGEETVNRDGEIAFKIEAYIQQDLNVRNDANKNSDRVGTIDAGLHVDIHALKNNGAELWGRIDQYGTAGWISLKPENATYLFHRFVNTDEQPIYVDANTDSAVKGTLPINKELVVTKVTTDGTNVYGWVEEGIFGWIPMSKTSAQRVEVIKTFKSGEVVGDYAHFYGTTFAAMDAYDAIGGSKVLFKMTSGVEVNIETIKYERGKAWGCVIGLDPAIFGEYAHAWVDMSKINYTISNCTVVESTGLNVRSSMDNSTTKDDEVNNIIATLPNGTKVNICQLSFDANGNVWARINGEPIPDAQVNGAFIMVMNASKTAYVQHSALPTA